LATEYYRYHGQKLEPMIIHKSNLCVANSEMLTDYCKKYNPNSYYVGQGCDISLFQNSLDELCPDDMGSIKGPVIGYVGALHNNRSTFLN